METEVRENNLKLVVDSFPEGCRMRTTSEGGSHGDFFRKLTTLVLREIEVRRLSRFEKFFKKVVDNSEAACRIRSLD